MTAPDRTAVHILGSPLKLHQRSLEHGNERMREFTLIDEADNYCRQGGTLLTLATPPEVKVLRHWYLGEFLRQGSGSPPIPWPVFIGSTRR
ncbi:MAG: hypothetical protein ABJA34_05055 [Pseudonocardiales bacterium]